MLNQCITQYDKELLKVWASYLRPCISTKSIAIDLVVLLNKALSQIFIGTPFIIKSQIHFWVSA
ncbi:hypothetical protein NUBL17186_46970 [Klebsiella quasipneumoniae]|nr:hypothetical protein NUBL17186_46970 [Klebsiella quasipneumoniae]